MSNVMKDKRTAYADLLRSTLQSFDAAYKVEERFRDLSQAGSAKARAEMMGDPVRYAEVLHRPAEAGGSDNRANSTRVRKDHRFRIMVYYEFDDKDSYSNSSQSTWDDIVAGDSGLIKTIEKQSTITGTSGKYSLMPLSDLDGGIIPIDQQAKLLTHMITFTQELRTI